MTKFAKRFVVIVLFSILSFSPPSYAAAKKASSVAAFIIPCALAGIVGTLAIVSGNDHTSKEAPGPTPPPPPPGQQNLYVGGNFTTAGPLTSVGRIAKWDGLNYWSKLDIGVGGSIFGNNVYTLAGSTDNVFVGGDFTTAGGLTANYIARWDGTSWHPLGTGTDGNVRALTIHYGNLYAGGDFTQAGGVANTSMIARWDPSDETWSALGSEPNIFNASVRALASNQTDIYIGGDFYTTTEPLINFIAKWNGSIFSSVGFNDLNDSVYALASNADDLYAGGFFTATLGNPGNYIAKWDGTHWLSLGTGVNWPVLAIIIVGDDLYVGGQFTQAGGQPANYIARYNITSNTWYSLGTGMNGYVYALARVGDYIYAGGSFTAPGKGIAKWNMLTSEWSPVDPAGVNGDVYALLNGDG